MSKVVWNERRYLQVTPSLNRKNDDHLIFLKSGGQACTGAHLKGRLWADTRGLVLLNRLVLRWAPFVWWIEPGKAVITRSVLHREFWEITLLASVFSRQKKLKMPRVTYTYKKVEDARIVLLPSIYKAAEATVQTHALCFFKLDFGAICIRPNFPNSWYMHLDYQERNGIGVSKGWFVEHVIWDCMNALAERAECWLCPMRTEVLELEALWTLPLFAKSCGPRKETPLQCSNVELFSGVERAIFAACPNVNSL